MISLEGEAVPEQEKREKDNFEFKTMTYNVLAECYVLPSRYAHCPEFARRWTYRSRQLLNEISSYNPDILFLQVHKSNNQLMRNSINDYY